MAALAPVVRLEPYADPFGIVQEADARRLKRALDLANGRHRGMDGAIAPLEPLDRRHMDPGLGPKLPGRPAQKPAGRADLLGGQHDRTPAWSAPKTDAAVKETQNFRGTVDMAVFPLQSSPMRRFRAGIVSERR
jgi:hypothetical protein